MALFRSKISSLREYLTPINHNSNFSTTGEISPEEFIKAGDYLVYKFPTWQWSGCPKKELEKSFLPLDKQFLITKHVPSYERANTYLTGINQDGEEDGEEEEEEEVDEDGWVKSKKIKHDKHTEEVLEIPEINDDIDEEEEEEENFDNDDDEEFDIIGDSNHNKLRKYDLYITYSTSYRVPKLYLVGFNSNGIPLLPNQMFEDINLDYKDKTATIEKLPVGINTTSVSIHPCKHSSVMKVLMKHSKLNKSKNNKQDINKEIQNLSLDDKKKKNDDEAGADDDDDEEEGIRVDHYLIIFLKFIASVTPGIEYDYTMDAL